jgi:hypothetical protein
MLDIVNEVIVWFSEVVSACRSDNPECGISLSDRYGLRDTKYPESVGSSSCKFQNIVDTCVTSRRFISPKIDDWGFLLAVCCTSMHWRYRGEPYADIESL